MGHPSRPREGSMKRINGRGPKDKGKAFEREIVATILEAFPQLSPNDVLARSMGDPGQDIILSETARVILPLAAELKRVESLNVGKAFEQAKANGQEGQMPCVIHRKSRCEALVTLKWSDLLKLLKNAQTK